MSGKMVGPGTVAHRARMNGFDEGAALREIALDVGLPEEAQVVARERAEAVPISDAGAARLLADAFDGGAKYACAERSFYVCGADGYWQRDDMQRVEHAAKTILPDAWIKQAQIHRDAGREESASACLKRAAVAGNRKAIGDGLALMKSEPSVAIESAAIFDGDPYLFGATNGAVDLRTGEFREVTPSMRLSRKGGCAYDAGARCLEFLAFLRWCFAPAGTPEEVEAHVEYVRRVLGIMLTGDRTAERFLVWHGNGANGKSTLLKVLQRLLGQYSVTAPSAMLNRTHHGRGGAQASPDIVAVIGKRLILANETIEGAHFDEQVLKALVSAEPMTARALYSAPVTFTPMGLLVVNGNWLPRYNGADGGVARRLDLWPFMNHVTEVDRDPALIDKLCAELPGILAWAVSGSVDWYSEGRRWPSSPIVRRASEAYRADQDLIGRWVTECCEQTPDKVRWLDTARAREWLSTWLRSEGHHGEFSAKRLTQRLEALGFPATEVRRGGVKTRRFQGLALAFDAGGA